MYDDQAIYSIDDFRSLDDESVKNICKVLLRPGGVMATGEPDLGVKVNLISESNMILSVYFIKH